MIYLRLFITFFKIGAFTFGGGYAMLPLIQETVIANKWMKMEDIIDFIAVSESTPGPFAVNIATFVGSQAAGIAGSLCATFGVVLPSFIVILLIAKFFMKFNNSKGVRYCMSGLKPAVIGLIASALLSLGTTVFIPDGFNINLFSEPWFYVSSAVFILSIILAFKKIHPIIVIFISAAAGIIFGLII